MIRLAHFSDVHITTDPPPHPSCHLRRSPQGKGEEGWELQDWFNKRLPGWMNFRWLGRAYRFRHADAVLAALVAELQQRRPDRIIFSGDATALGFETEMARAAALLKVAQPEMPPGLAVPGNHDYYTRVSAAKGTFERTFAPWQAGERIDGAIYPFAQRVGPIWLVAVNSCTGNRWAWDAGGGVDGPQLERLRRLFERLEPGPRILVTHYPICLANGKPERKSHGLRNFSEVIAAASAGGVGLWLHGHRHGAYHLLQPAAAPFPVICVGSATQTDLWSYNEYAVDGSRVQASCRVYDPQKNCFEERESFEVELSR